MLSLKHGSEICKIIKDKKVSNTVYVSDLTTGDTDDNEDPIKHLICDSKEKIQVTPPRKHIAMGVYGSSGVGKSFFISQFVSKFKKMFPFLETHNMLFYDFFKKMFSDKFGNKI